MMRQASAGGYGYGQQQQRPTSPFPPRGGAASPAGSASPGFPGPWSSHLGPGMSNLGPGPASPNPNGSAAGSSVSLDAWSRGLLGEKQMDTVSRLSEWAKKAEGRRAASSSSSQQDEVPRPLEGPADPSDSRGHTAPAPEASSSKLALPAAPITSSSALLQWLESVKSAPATQADATAASAKDPSSSSGPSSVADYEASLAQMKAASERTTQLLSQLEMARINVAELKAGAKSVEETSEELREESEKRGGRSESLLQLAHQLDTYLSYYALLPAATSFLSSPSPSLSLVLSPKFSLTLAQLDIGLKFVQAHPHFRDASIYRLRFEYCLTRGGNLARMWLTNKLRELKNEGTQRLKERERNLKSRGKDKEQDAGDVEGSGTLLERQLLDLASPSTLQILYTKFVASVPELRSVLSEIQKRCPPPAASQPPAQKKSKNSKAPTDEEALLADYSVQEEEGEDREEASKEAALDDENAVNTFEEYQTFLTDCRAAYFDARRGVLLPVINAVLTRVENHAQALAQAQAQAQTEATEDKTGKVRAKGAAAQTAVVLFASHALIILKSILSSEAILYADVFGPYGTSSSSDPSALALVDFLKGLAKGLLDRLHPRIFAESKISVLSALAAAVLQAACPRDISAVDSHAAADDADGYLLFSAQDPYDFSSIPRPHRLSSAHEHTTSLISPLFQPIMEDIVTRLLFRSSAVLNGPDVAGYQPSSTSGTDELVELVRKVVRASGRGTAAALGRRGKRGRSSLGVGVLEAAARRALDAYEGGNGGEEPSAQHLQVLAQSGSGPRKDASPGRGQIELFALPRTHVLATWYPPLVRAFTILSLLHPVLNRRDFAKVGVDAVERARAALSRASEALSSRVSRAGSGGNKAGAEKASGGGASAQDEVDEDEEEEPFDYDPDLLDAALFSLRNALLLREVSASVELSLTQASPLDRIEEELRGAPSAHAQSPAGAGAEETDTNAEAGPAVGSTRILDLGVVMRVMGGLLEGIGFGSGGAAQAPAQAAHGQTHNAELTTASRAVVQAIIASLEALPSSFVPECETREARAWLEEALPRLRRARRRAAMWLEDDEVVDGLVRGVVEWVEGSFGEAQVEKGDGTRRWIGEEIRRRMALSGGEAEGKAERLSPAAAAAP